MPLCNLVAVLLLDGHGFDQVLPAQVEEVLVVRKLQDFELSRIPMLRVNLFEVDLSRLKSMVVYIGAWLTDVDTKVELKVGGLIAHAVDAVSVELILCHSLLEEGR